MYDYLLSLAIWLPILAGIVVLATGTDSRAGMARVLALVGALASFLVTLPLFTGFDRLNGGFQFTEFHSWIPALNLNYALGVDGLSVLFIILNLFIRKPRPTGSVSGLFLIGYGAFRIIVEFFRQPDAQFTGTWVQYISMGQILSIPMIIAGIAMMVWAFRRPQQQVS